MKAVIGHVSLFCALMLFGGLYLYAQLDNKILALSCQIQVLEGENIKLRAELVSAKHLVATGQLKMAESNLQMLRLQRDLLSMSEVLRLTLKAFLEVFDPSPQQPAPEVRTSPQT